MFDVVTWNLVTGTYDGATFSAEGGVPLCTKTNACQPAHFVKKKWVTRNHVVQKDAK